MENTISSEYYPKRGCKIYYPINSFFNDESKLCHYKNYKMWNQIQPEIQAIADQVITDMELVNMAIQEIRKIRKNDNYSSEYEKRIKDAICAIFSVGKYRFQTWIDQCDKDLHHEYSGELFC